MRAPGMTPLPMPIMVWTVLVTSVLVLLATPAPTSALIMLFIDPQPAAPVRSARRRLDPVLVHLLVLLAPRGLRHGPAGMGFSEILPVFSRKPLFGYKAFVFVTGGHRRPRLLGGVHYMFTTGAVYLPFFSLMTFPDRGPDRRQDVQLDLHDVARQAAAVDTAVVRPRVPEHVPRSVVSTARSRPPCPWTSRCTTPTGSPPICTTCCSAGPCSA